MFVLKSKKKKKMVEKSITTYIYLWWNCLKKSKNLEIVIEKYMESLYDIVKINQIIKLHPMTFQNYMAFHGLCTLKIWF